jgi:hypothetical protein
MNEIINKFLLDDDFNSLTRDDVNVDLTHEESILLNVELLAIISDLKFYLDNVNLSVVSDIQIISDLKSILES